jgi:hypothetical protein
MLSGNQTLSGGKIEAFVNNGAGTSFVKTWESALYGQYYGTIYNIFSTKLNIDAFPDIVATEIYDGLLLTFSGNGPGTFTEETTLNLGDRAFSLTVGEVNIDSLTDLATYVGWGHARVYLTQANNTVTEYWRSPDLGEAAFNLALKDFDRDGYDDLFVGTFGDGALRIFRNRQGNDFVLVWSAYLAGEGYTGMATDVDNDGYPDLIVGEMDTNNKNTIRILHSEPNVSFISGRVVDTSDKPLANVTVTLNSGASTTTDINGNYHFTDLATETYSITPTLANYIFSPNFRDKISVPPNGMNEDFLGAPVEVNPRVWTEVLVGYHVQTEGSLWAGDDHLQPSSGRASFWKSSAVPRHRPK